MMDNKEILEKNGGKRFDCVLMNPPYDRSLHLKFLEKVIEIGDNVVSIQPSGWLTDTYANDKKSNFKKFEKSILQHIKDIEFFDYKSISAKFNILSHHDVAIYLCNKEGGYDYASIPYLGKVQKMIDITKNNESLSEHIELNKVDGIRVKTQAIKNGAPPRSNLEKANRYTFIDKYSLMYNTYSCVFVDGYGIDKSHKWWSFYGAKNKYTKKKGEPIPHSIKFDSIEEAKNFENYCKTDFFIYCMYLSKVGVNTDFSHLPWIGNVKWKGKSGEINGYKNEITDEMLYEYFKLSKEDVELIKKTLDGDNILYKK